MHWINDRLAELKRNKRKQLRVLKKYRLFATKIAAICRSLQNCGCCFVYIATPEAKRIRRLSEFERERLKGWSFDFNHIRPEDNETLRVIYGPAVSEEYLTAVYSGAKVIKTSARRSLADYQSELVNIVNGVRLTTDRPAKWHNCIHIYGACTVRGGGVEDACTIASFMQRTVNERFPDGYLLVNHGIGCGSNQLDDVYRINNTVLYQGDIVVLCDRAPGFFKRMLRWRGVPLFDSSHCFDRPHDYGEWFTDHPAHTNKVGNRVLADYIRKFSCKNTG